MVWVLIMSILEPGAAIVHRGVGPFGSEAECLQVQAKIMEIAYARSESHALVVHCREATAEEIDTLKELHSEQPRNPGTERTSTAEIDPVHEFVVVDRRVHPDGRGQ